MSLKSNDLDLGLVRRLEEEADTMSVELDGKVSLVQSKNGVVLLRDEIDGEVILQAIKHLIEQSLRRLEDNG